VRPAARSRPSRSVELVTDVDQPSTAGAKLVRPVESTAPKYITPTSAPMSLPDPVAVAAPQYDSAGGQLTGPAHLRRSSACPPCRWSGRFPVAWRTTVLASRPRAGHGLARADSSKA
jgi:hypothetical protein